MTGNSAILEQTFHDVLKSHLGKTFTIVNPEAYEESGVGHAIQADWYEGKLVAIGQDFLVLVHRFRHGAGRHATTEPVEQYLPIAHVKRISLMKQSRCIHL